MIGPVNFNSLAILMLSLLALSACASTSESNFHAPPPTSWLDQFEGAQSSCRDFSNDYRNEGERAPGSAKAAIPVYLSDSMFSRLGDGQLPDTVGVQTDERSSQVRVSLRGDATRNLEYEIGCESGWFVLKSANSGQYLGDGVVEKSHRQLSFFRIGSQGELIVRVVADAEFNSMYVFDSKASADEWYRFQPVQRSNG